MTKWNPSSARIQELMVFRAILESGSLTKAALGLGLTQSGVSKRLKFLRQWFGDELFVRTERGMKPTSKALSITPQITNILTEFEELSGAVSFNPSELDTSFVISTTDDLQYHLLPNLINKFRTCAPKSKLMFKPLESSFSNKQLESGSVDLVITLNWQVPEHFKQRRLFSDDFVCLIRTGHPLQKKKLTFRDFVSADHLMVSPLATGYSPIDEYLAARGHKRFVRLAIPNFMQVERVLQNTDMIVTLPRTAAEALATVYPLHIKELPISVNSFSYYLFWHKRYDKDSANSWLRELIYEVLNKD